MQNLTLTMEQSFRHRYCSPVYCCLPTPIPASETQQLHHHTPSHLSDPHWDPHYYYWEALKGEVGRGSGGTAVAAVVVRADDDGSVAVETTVVLATDDC